MDKHGSLKILLDTLLDKESLNSWQIYEEKNGSVVVRIRFAARHCKAIVTGATNITDEENIIAYKRKSSAQIRRDNERAKQHHERRITRSQTLNVVDNIVPRDISEPEFVCSSDNDLFSDTRNPGLVSPVPCAVEPISALDPLVSPNEPPIGPEWSCPCRLGGYGSYNNPYAWCVVSRYRICISGFGHIVTALFSSIWQCRWERPPSPPFGCHSRYWWSPQHPQHCFGVCWWCGGS